MTRNILINSSSPEVVYMQIIESSLLVETHSNHLEFKTLKKERPEWNTFVTAKITSHWRRVPQPSTQTQSAWQSTTLVAQNGQTSRHKRTQPDVSELGAEANLHQWGKASRLPHLRQWPNLIQNIQANCDSFRSNTNSVLHHCTWC